MADESIGTARIDIIVNTDQFESSVQRAKTLTSGMGGAAQAAWAKMDAAAKRNATLLIRWAETLGKTAEEQKLLNAAMRGVPIEVLEEVRKKIAANREAQQQQADATRQATAALAAQAEAARNLAFAQQAAAIAAQRAADQRTQALLAERAALEAIAQARQKDLELAQQANVAAAQRSYASTTQALMAERAAIEAVAAARQRDLLIAQESNAAAAQRAASAQTQALLNERAALAAVAEARRQDLAAAQQANALAAKLSYQRNTQALLDERSAMERSTAERVAFIAGLKSESSAMIKTRADLLEMKAAQLGVAKDAAPFIERLRQQEIKLGANGKSAKELNFALRGLPAQFTDIAVSLQSGQRPLTVLLQQGGQIKDMFGGVGQALKAMGGYLIGLINPLTLTAAAAAALAIAWKQGSDEEVAYNKALITTGNYAGLTASRLQEMAAGLVKGNVTQHAAAATLAEVAATGKFTAEQIRLVGSAALDMSTLTGQATSETVKQFESLSEKPVEAILKLNDAQHFLTTATYEQIKALEEQGRTQDAATLAMRTYSEALNDRRAEVVRNAGLMERAWDGVKGAAKRAWDAMLDVGRAESDDDKLGRLQREANGYAAAIQKIKDAQAAGAVPVTSRAYADRQIKILQDQFQKASAAYYAEEKRQEEARKDATTKAAKASLVQIEAASDADVKQFATNAQKRAAEIIKAKGEYNDRIAKAVAAGDKALAEKLRSSEKLVLAGINQKYKDPKTPSPKSDPFDSLNSLVKKAQVEFNNFGLDNNKQGKQVADILAIVDAGAKLISSGKDVAQVQAEVATGVDAVNKLYAAQAEQLRQKNLDAVNAYKASLQDMLDTRQQQIDLQVQSIGMGQREIAQQQALIAIEQDYNRKKSSLIRQQQNTTSAIQKQFYQDQLDALDAYHDESVRRETAGWGARAAAEADGLNGMKAAIADFMESQQNLAEQTRQITEDFIDGFGSAFASFASGASSAKKAFGDLLDDMYQRALRFVANKAIQAIFDSFGSGKNQTPGTTNGGWASLAANFMSYFSANANGGVYNSPGLSAYSSKIVDRPTWFAFAHGAGLMGEAGPEAILPLKRSANGKLGVRMEGGRSGAAQVSVQQTIVVQGRMDRRTQDQMAQESARRMRLAQSRNG